MHIGQPGSPVPVNGINIYSFNAITTGVNARALRVPDTRHKLSSSLQGCWKGRKCVCLSQTELLLRWFVIVILLFFSFSNPEVSALLHGLNFGGSGSHHSQPV